MITTNIRVYNKDTWAKIKILAEQQHISANALINQLLDRMVARHNIELPDDDQNE